MSLTAITKDFITRAGIVVRGAEAVSSSTGQVGALQVLGGAAFAKNLIAGTTATIWGESFLKSTLDVDGNGVFNSNVNVAQLFTATGAATLGDTLDVTGIVTLLDSTNAGAGTGALVLSNGGAYIKQDLFVDGTTAAGTGTGALIVNAGGGYISGDLWVNGSTAGNTGNGALRVNNGGAWISGDTFIGGSSAGTLGGGALVVGAGGGYFHGDLYVNGGTPASAVAGALRVSAGGLSVAEATWVNSTSTAVDTGGGDGALRVTGGVWIGDNLIVKSTAADTGTSSANALYLAGGAWVDKTLHVVEDAVFGGNVYFNGTATYVFSTNTFYTDNIIELHVPPTGVNTPWIGDDGKDIGLRFHYFNGTDKNGALVLANDSHYLEWYDSGAESSGGNFTTATYGTFKTGSIKLVNTTAATNTGSGALTVEGGVGIGGDLYVGGTINAAVILSTSTVVASVSTATNLAYGQAGEIPIQSATGQTTFIAAGTANDQVLTWSNSTATWASAGSTTVGASTTATNLAGGAQYDIPFQSGVGLTTFDTGVFTYNDSTKALAVSNITIDGNSGNDASTSISAASGESIELYSDDYVELNYNGVAFVTAGPNGAKLVAGGVNFELDTSGNATLGGSGYLKAPYVRADNLVSGRVVFSNVDHQLVDDSNLTFDSNSGILTAAYVNPDNLTDTRVPYYNGTNGYLVDSANLTFDGTTLSAGGFYTNGNLQIDTSGSLTLSYAQTNAVAFVNSSGDLVTEAGFDYNPDGLGVGAGLLTADNFTATNNAYVGGNLYVGGDIYLDGVGLDTVYGTTATFLDVISTGTVFANHITATDIFVTTTATIGGDLFVDGQIYMQGVGLNTITASTGTFDYVVVEGTGTGLTVVDGAAIQGTTQAVSTQSGALQVSGGVGIAKTLHVGQDLWVTGTAHIANIGIDSATLETLTVNSTATLNGPVFANTTTQADGHGYDTGAVQIAGGLLVKKNIVAGGLVIAGDYSGGASPTNPSGQVVEGFYSNNNMQASYTSPVLSSTSTVTLDAFDSTLYQSAKYIVQVVDSGNVHAAEILAIHDGTDVYITEYGVISNNGDLGIFDADIVSGDVVLKFTPTSATAMTVQVVRQSILAAVQSYAV